MVNRVRLPQSIGRIGVRLWGPFIIGAVVSLAVVVIIAAISADVQRRDAATLQREIAQRVATGLDLYVRQLQDDVATLAETLPLIGSDLEAQRLQLKAATSKLDSPIYQLSIVGLDGTERVKAIQHRPHPADFENLSGDPAVAAALAGRTYFGPVYNSEFGVPFVDMAVPIRDALGHTQAVLRAEIDLSTLWSLVNTASVGEEGYVYVIGADGALLAYHDVPRLMTQPSVGNLPQVQDALQNVALPVAREYATGLERAPVLAYYLSVDIGPGEWDVIVEQPLSDAYAQADLFSLIGAGLSAVALAAILIMGLFIRQRIARPIEALRRGAAALGSGDLNHRISIDTGDELEFLAHEFNQMSGTLQQSQARLAGLARERERQAEDAQSRVREMSALIQSGRAITSLDLETVLSRLAREVAHAVQGDRCSIYVFDARQRRLALRGEWEARRAESERGVPSAGVNGTVAFEWGEGIVGLVAEQGKPLFLANAQADRRFVPKAPNDHDIAALIGIPLLSDANVVGVLQASTCPGTPPFDPSDQRLLGTFADQASAAIKNSFLYETERRRAQEMSVIAEIIRTISASLDLDTTLDSILSTVRRLIAYDLAEITLWDAEHEVLRTRGRGADPRYAEYSRTTGGTYQLDQGFSGWIASHRAPLLVADAETSEVRPAVDLEQFPIRSMAGVPLTVAQQLIGTLELVSYTPDAFSESHLDTLRTIAAQAAVAIQNAQLYQESRRRAEELSSLFRAASFAASAQEPNEVLRQIMAEVAGLLSAQLGVVLLFNPDTALLEAHPAALFGRPAEEVADFCIDTRVPGFERSVFRTGRVFRSDNAPSDERVIAAYQPFIGRFQVRGVLSAPLVVRDQHIGEVHIARTNQTPFDRDDEQRLLTFATLLSGVIESAGVAAERGARLNELAGLYEISQAVSSITDLKQVYARITASIAQRAGVAYAGILLYDAEREALVSQPPFYGLPDAVLEHYLIPLASSDEARRLWSESAIWISNDVPNDALTKAAGLDGLAQAVGVRRTLLAVMSLGARRIGVIQVSNKLDGQPFNEQDARLMSIYATQIAVVVENARLYALTDVRLHKRIEELTALSAISQELNATLDRERIFDLVLNEAVRATGATHGNITLYDPNTLELIPRALLGYTAEEVERQRLIRQKVGEGIVGKVIESGESLLIDNVREHPEYLQLAASTQSELAMPIRYAWQVVGAINLESPQPAHFTPDHVSFVQALASQAAIAIGNAQRYEEQLARGELLRSRAEQLANLFEIGQAFRSDRPLIEVLDDVVHAVQETTGFNLVMLSLLADDPPVLERVSAAGLPVSVFEAMKAVRQPWSTISQALQDVFRISQSYYIPMEHREAGMELNTWPPAQEELTPRVSGQWHVEDLLIVPLRGSGDRILGIMSVDGPLDGRVPDRAAIETLELFANQAAIAVENARLLEDLEQRIDSLTLFNQVSRTISARLDLDGLLSTIVDASSELSGARTATIFLRDEATGQFTPRKSHGWALAQIAHLTWAEDEGLVGAVAREGRAIIVPNAKADARFRRDPIDSQIAAMLLVPIAVGGRVIGVLSVDKPTPRSFTNTDMMMLSTLADQAAIAIENARLFGETRQRAQRLALINEISVPMSIPAESSAVLQAAVDGLARALDVSQVGVALYDETRQRLTVVADHPAPDSPTAVGTDLPVVGNLSLEQVQATQAPLYIEDTQSDPLMASARDLMLRRRVRSILIVPLIVGDTIIGTLGCDAVGSPRRFTRDEIELAQTVANLLAVRVERARLYEAAQRRLAEQAVLLEASAASTSIVALDRVLDSVGQQFMRGLNVQTVTLTKWDRARNQSVVMVDRDVQGLTHSDPAGTTYDLSTYPGAVQVLEDVQPRVLRLGDAAIDDLDRVNLERLKLKALLMLPLVAQDRVIGMVELGERERDRSFTTDEIRLAQTLANQAAIAITNAELFAETQRRVAELQTINAVGQAITATMPLSELVELIRREVGRVIDVSSFYIGLYDAPSDRITFPIFYDHGLRTAADPKSGGGGVTGHIIHTRRPLLLNMPEEVNVLGLPSDGNDWLSYVGVPLMIGELVTGVMAVQDTDRVFAYDEGHVRILSTIASQAASAIENARLFEETQRRLREQSLLHEAGRAMSASLEYSAVLEIAADQLLRITGMQGAILFELDRDRTSLSIVHSAYLEAADIRAASLPAGELALADFPHVEQAVRLRAAHLMRVDDPGLALGEVAYLEQAGLACALTVPMISRDQVIGVVQLVDMRTGRAFGEAYLRLIETLVNQVASALTNARLFDEVRRFTQELEARVRQRTDELATANTQLTLERDRVETLYRITSELSASLDLDRVLNRALTLVNEAVGTARGSILLIDREANVLTHRAALGRSTPLPAAGHPTRFKPDQGLAGWVIKNRLPAIVPDIRRDDRWEEPGERESRLYRSALAVPLVYGDDALGALLLLHEEEDYFAETQLRLVEAAAVQVATAINNAELYGFIRESAERLGAMLRDKQVESAKAQAILESVTDGVLVADASGTVILFNAAAERILSRARSTVMGRPSADLAGLYGVAGPEWEAQIREWRDRPETRRSVPALSHRIEFEDEKRFVTVSIAPVAGPGEELLGTVSVFRDITVEVRADRAKSEFVSTVSHELRTPMTSIKGYADLLLMGVTGPLAGDQEHFVHIIKSNADRLSVLVNDLLDISRFETGRAVLDLKPVSLAAALEQVVTSLHERIEQKGLELRTEVPEGDLLTAWADRDRVIQVLTNLISNAYQYTPSGGRITIRARATDDGMLQVDVQDTGIGIADEDQPKIFDRFFRSDDPAVQEFSGTGLGLSIVQSLVHLHGGELWINSRLGHGSTFSFTLPQAASDAQPAEIEPLRAEPSTRPAPRRESARVPRILVVEDDPDIAALIVHNLKQVGYAAVSVATGRAAIEQARRDRPDLITLDIYLPDIDGWKVLNALKTDPVTANVPVVVVSIVPENKESLELGAAEYLVKPLDATVLLDTISRLLGHSGRVLIVEDDLATSTMLSEALQRAGLRVLVTANGTHALKLAKEEQPDLILLDLKLPRMDGYTVLQNLRQMPATTHTPVMIMTGSVTLDETRRREFTELGASSFLIKPFDMQVLLDQIEAVLKRPHVHAP